MKTISLTDMAIEAKKGSRASRNQLVIETFAKLKKIIHSRAAWLGIQSEEFENELFLKFDNFLAKFDFQHGCWERFASGCIRMFALQLSSRRRLKPSNTFADLDVPDQFQPSCFPDLTEGLEADQRKLLEDRFVYQYSVQEIADHHGMSARSIYRRIEAAIGSLRVLSRNSGSVLPTEEPKNSK